MPRKFSTLALTSSAKPPETNHRRGWSEGLEEGGRAGLALAAQSRPPGLGGGQSGPGGPPAKPAYVCQPQGDPAATHGTRKCVFVLLKLREGLHCWQPPPGGAEGRVAAGLTQRPEGHDAGRCAQTSGTCRCGGQGRCREAAVPQAQRQEAGGPADAGTQPTRAASFPALGLTRPTRGQGNRARGPSFGRTRHQMLCRPLAVVLAQRPRSLWGPCLCQLCSPWRQSPCTQSREQPAPLTHSSREGRGTGHQGVSVVLSTRPSVNFFRGSLFLGANPHAGGPYLPACLGFRLGGLGWQQRGWLTRCGTPSLTTNADWSRPEDADPAPAAPCPSSREAQ